MNIRGYRKMLCYHMDGERYSIIRRDLGPKIRLVIDTKK